MAGLYDEKIVGAKERAAFARKLRENAANDTGQMVSGHYVPNIMGAVQSIVGGWQEGKANEEKENLEREKAQATISAMNKMGYEAPESFLKQAQTPEQSPEFLNRAAAFLRGEDQPQTIPAQPYKQNVAQNVNPEDQQRAMLNLATINPDIGSIYMQFEKVKRDNAKEARQQQMEKIPTGFLPDENGGIKPMVMYDQNGNKKSYAQHQIDIANATAQARANVVTPSQQQAMEMANKNYDLANKRNTREEEKYQEEKNKPVVLNEGQSSAYNYANRMIDADKILSSLNNVNQTGVNLSRTAKNALGEIGGNLANSMLSEKNQQAKNAQENFLTAILRKESGASIGPTEFEMGNQLYFPQTGDKPEVLAQKAKNRELSIQGLKAQIPTEYLNLHPFGESDQSKKQPISTRNIPSQDAIAAEMARRGLK